MVQTRVIKLQEIKGLNALATCPRSMRNSNLEIRIAGSSRRPQYSDSRKNGSCMEVRLNSPGGKFKITNMSDDQVDFTPEDIPGASFIEEEIEKVTVAQLKFWLKCVRINQLRRNCWKGSCISSSGFARSINCLC